MKPRALGFLITFFCIFPAGVSAAAESPVPDDRKIEIFEDDPDEFKKGTPILERNQLIEVHPDGSYRETVYLRIRFYWGYRGGWTYLLGWKKKEDPLPTIEIAKIRRDKGRDTDLKNFELIESSVDPYYDYYGDNAKVSLKIMTIEEDDELELKYTFVHSPTTEFPSSFADVFEIMSWGLVKKATWTIRYPASMDLQFKQVGFESRPKEGTDGETRYYTISMKNLNDRDWISKLPDSRSIYPFFMVTSESSWDRLGRWSLEQYRSHMTITPEIQSTVDDLTRGLTDLDDKASAIFRYVADEVEYFGIYLDKCGWIPHEAGETFRKKFGDCKDKSALFITMLEAAGIKACPAKIDAGSYYWSDRDFPMMYQFNHIITYIPDAKHSKWFDPTWPASAACTLPTSDRGRPAFVLFDEGPRFIETPPLDRDSWKKTSSAKITISDDGSMRAEGEQTLDGTLGIRRIDFLRSNTQETIDENIKSTIFDHTINPELVSFDVLSNLDEGLPLRTRTVYSSEDHVQHAGGLMIFQIPYGSDYNLHEGLSQRELPLVLRPKHYTASIDLEIPEGWAIRQIPDAVEEDHPFGGFRFSYTEQDRGLHIDSEVWVSVTEIGRGELEEKQIGISELEQFRRFEQHLAKALQTYFVIGQ
ncbi:transglutaminase family protein [Thermodesulfobacteriota bacterium]